MNEKEDKIDHIIAGGDLDSFLEAWDNELLQAQNVIPVDNDEQRVPTVFGLQTIKEKGAFRCGYECLANLPRQERENFDNFCKTQSRNTEPNVEQPVQPESSFNNVPPKQDELVSIMFNRRSRRQKSFANILKREITCELLEANGSAGSIID